MVLYYTSNVVDPPITIYMGRDKFENEDLIKHGWEEDVWFHVDKLSSAHVYLRLQPCKLSESNSNPNSPLNPKKPSPKLSRKDAKDVISAASKAVNVPPNSVKEPEDGIWCRNWESIPEALLADCAQLVKANSIEGNKKNNVPIIYTPWSNIKKTAGMDTGTVTFHNPNLVRRVNVPARVNEIVNRLNKTKEERNTDLEKEKLEKLKMEREEKKNAERERKKLEEEQQEMYQKQKELKSYTSLFDESEMASNRYTPIDEDDFM